MGLFRDIISDAHRPLRAGGPLVQRMADAPAPEPLSPAPPIEEQPDGALTIYRFQKEGRLVPREVPKRVETGPRQSRRGDPSLVVGRSSESDGRATQSVDSSVTSDDGSVIASRRKNGLATGKGDTEHSVRQDSVVNEASSVGLKGIQQRIREDLWSIESPPDQHDPADTYTSDNLQREAGERELSRDAGLGTPSESSSTHRPTMDERAQAPARFQPLVSGPDELAPAPSADAPEPLLGPHGTFRPTAEGLHDDPAVAAHPEMPSRFAPHSVAATAPLDGQPPETRRPPEQPALEAPRVSIGQIDVVVVSDAPAPPAPAARPGGLASRRYWRRL